jgi:hypothetical protein
LAHNFLLQDTSGLQENVRGRPDKGAPVLLLYCPAVVTRTSARQEQEPGPHICGNQLTRAHLFAPSWATTSKGGVVPRRLPLHMHCCCPCLATYKGAAMSYALLDSGCCLAQVSSCRCACLLYHGLPAAVGTPPQQ